MTRDHSPGQALFAGLLSCIACNSAFFAAGPTLDAGTLGVSGVETGIGAHAEAGLTQEHEGGSVGAGLAGTLSGFSSEGDTDPIFFTSLEARYRRYGGTPDRGVRPFYGVGGGPVMAWVAGPRKGGLVLNLEIGLRGGRGLEWWLGLRERPVGMIGGQAEFFNSVQLIAALGWSWQPPLTPR